ncbi:protein of unknown function [Cupriavidus taiwanensis]|nr:protein of unknown function [Cupriavidus taiwanensis]
MQTVPWEDAYARPYMQGCQQFGSNCAT